MEKKMHLFAVEHTVIFGSDEEAGEEILFVSSYSDGSAMIETDCSTYEWGIYEKPVF